MANQRIKANLIPSCDIYPVIHLAQYDVSDGTGKQVEIELYYGTDKFTIPSGSSITFRGTKRDKTGYSYEITKFSDNVVTVDVKPQMTVLSGTHFAELRISKGNTISNTIKFVMKIDSSALADDTKVSETDLSVIEKALQASDAAIQAKAEVEQLKASVEKSEKNAKQSETNASQSATNAQESAESASNSAKEAKDSADSIANVTSDVEKLKEDLPNKITKFYASNQGETHITDSDNGKIQDMMVYGKSSQDGTPSVENPVEIKSVVNPTVTLLGSNILKINDSEYRADEATFTVSNGVINGKGATNNKINFTISENIFFKEGTEIIFSPNIIKGTETDGGAFLDFSNRTTIGFSIANHNINTPYIIKERDTKYPFRLSIRGNRNSYDKTWKPQLLIGKTITPFKPYTEQTIKLPITLNAIPVSSGGNVTINGQQYISDRLVEKDGVYGIERNVVDALKNISNQSIEIDLTRNNTARFRIASTDILESSVYVCICNILPYGVIWNEDNEGVYTDSQYVILRINKSTCGEDEQTAKDWLISNINKFYVYACLKNSKFEPLSSDVQEKLKMLSTYYPVTNITAGSEQLDGYTVFNYPISLANGWNYVKQQLNDNRDYIYDMDLQSAEAYVNSEYAVTLTELEV